LSSAGSPAYADTTMLYTMMRNDRPKTNAPTVASWCQGVIPGSKAKSRRGVSHATNIGKYSRLKPTKKTAKWSFPRNSSYIRPVIFGYQ